MKARPDRLYDLLPVVYRMRDADQGYPLRDFLRVLGQQANVLEADIARLYDNWFIETCDDWVVPYIGDLIGFQLSAEARTLGEDGRPNVRLGRVLVPRRDVANVISSRRRKGTLSLLEDLARDVADWPGRAVEFYRLLGWMQHLDHQHPRRGGTADLRRPGPLECLGGAFDAFARAVDVRRLDSQRTRGRYNVPAVGLFVFRLRSYSVTKTAAYCVEERGAQNYAFSILGNDTPLFQRQIEESQPTHVAREENLPVPIRRYRFAVRGNNGAYDHASANLYGEGKSLLIYAPDWPKKGAGLPVPIDAVLPANLSGWRYRVPRDHVAVDPHLGRLVFPADQRPRNGVWVTYQYGFAADIGGGEYARPTVELAGAQRYEVHAAMPEGAPDPSKLPPGHFASVTDALAAWRKAKDEAQAEALQAAKNAGLSDADAAAKAQQMRPRALIVEFAESGVYEGPLDLSLDPGEAIQLRAAERTRPVLRLFDNRSNGVDAIGISGQPGSRVVFDGLMIVGRGIEAQGPAADDQLRQPDDLCEIVIRHCTLVPGWTLHCDCDPKQPGEPSITLDRTRAAVRIEHSIIGPISVISPPRHGEPLSLSVCNSVLDATAVERLALGSPTEAVAAVAARFERCTVIGEVQAHSVSHAQDSIFAGRMRVMRRQTGCMRFCYVPDGSRTPRRFHCQPDLVIEATRAIADPAVWSTRRAQELLRVVPELMSQRYGSVNYARLDDACCEEIRAGASDESAMGVFHDLYEPQREANLATRLEEFVPAGTDAGILFAS
jgi:hypothetical protein